MAAQLDNIKRKIRALLAMAEDGANEAESLAAAAKARDLMDQYEVTVTIDAYQADNAIVREKVSVGRKRADRIWVLAHYIAQFADCEYWLGGATVYFMGYEADAQMAQQLFRLCVITRDGEYARFAKSAEARELRAAGAHGLTLRASFTDGFTARVGSRLSQMKRKSEEARPSASTGSGLIVLKNESVKAEVERLGMKFRSAHMSGPRSFGGFNAGERAGDAVPLSKSVNESGKLEMRSA